MSHTIAIECQCKKVQGELVSMPARGGSHVVCMCCDCQAFARWLGKPDQFLDQWGGSEIFQCTPDHLRFTEGQENLQCMRLSPKGLFRWYASCCNTPIANTSPKASFAFVGVLAPAIQCGELSKDEALGPMRGRVQGQHGKGPLPPGSHQKFPIALVWRLLKMAALGRMAGKHRKSPFFDTQGQPIAAPQVISKEEKEKLYT